MHFVSVCVRHFAVVLRRLNSMAELTDFLPYVRRHISGPLSIMMTDALSMSAVAFCRQSLLCR
ncbi:hypothetical protein ACLL1F_000860, partial [Escherichia coli]